MEGGRVSNAMLMQRAFITFSIDAPWQNLSVSMCATKGEVVAFGLNAALNTEMAKVPRDFCRSKNIDIKIDTATMQKKKKLQKNKNFNL